MPHATEPTSAEASAGKLLLGPGPLGAHPVLR
jgi:hypothetical protein